MQLVLRIVEYPKINFGWDAVVALFRYLKNPSYRLGPIWFRRLFLIGVYAGGAYPRRIYSYVLWAYFIKLTFLGGLSAGGTITDFHGMYATIGHAKASSNKQRMHGTITLM